MQDRPSIIELIDAVRRFLEQQVVPAFEGTRQFHARVAANVLAIVGRELCAEPGQLRAEWRRLSDLLGTGGEQPADPDALRAEVVALNQTLAARIRAGDADGGAFRTGVLRHLRLTAREKLRVANPRYLEQA